MAGLLGACYDAAYHSASLRNAASDSTGYASTDLLLITSGVVWLVFLQCPQMGV